MGRSTVPSTQVRNTVGGVNTLVLTLASLGDKFTLKSHLKKHHWRTEDSLICTICGKILKTTQGMKKHVERYHEKHDKHLKCRYCELMFDTYSKKVGHEFEVHNYNSHICVLCGKKIRKGTIDIHMAIHHSEKNIPCEICGKIFIYEQ